MENVDTASILHHTDALREDECVFSQFYDLPLGSLAEIAHMENL